MGKKKKLKKSLVFAFLITGGKDSLELLENMFDFLTMSLDGVYQ